MIKYWITKIGYLKVEQSANGVVSPKIGKQILETSIWPIKMEHPKIRQPKLDSQK